MEILNILLEHKIIFSILIGILIINFSFIFYFIIKERKEDKKEIDEILNELEPKNIEEDKKQDEQVENNKKEVEEMLLKMQKDLEAKPEDVVTNFENEQEENSIISYQELLNSVKEKNNNVNVQTVKIEEPEKVEIEDISDDTLELEPLEDKKFKSTEFISPIFGRQNNKIKYPTVPKLNSNIFDEIDFKPQEKIEKKIEILDNNKLDEEIKKNDDFLKALKEFRKNLE